MRNVTALCGAKKLKIKCSLVHFDTESTKETVTKALAPPASLISIFVCHANHDDENNRWIVLQNLDILKFVLRLKALQICEHLLHQ
mmetsp:Transcript_82490/g.146166  ORF Transcript_82490/g.146166 Transcript_82490/m.146166 type:complete len:86 (-) Transcript_82490:590-847(-)